jgi:hypothetical protein
MPVARQCQACGRFTLRRTVTTVAVRGGKVLGTHADRAAGSSPTPDPAEVRAEIEAVLRSPAFERTPRLQRFLQYISEVTLAGDGERLHEHLVAQEVFGRGADYSPGEDSIVRRQAHALRAKLERFYATEGAHHAVVIELPVGRYMPAFRRQSSGAGSATVPPSLENAEAPLGRPPAEPPVERAQAGRRAWTGALLGAALLGLGVMSGVLLQTVRERRAQATTAKSAEEVWGAWLLPSKGVAVCFTNRMTASLRYVDEPDRMLPDGWYLPASSEGDTVFRRAFNLPAGGRLNVLPESVMIKVGEAQAAVRLASFFGEHRVPLRTLQSRHLTWDHLRRERIVLLGQGDMRHSGISHWVTILLEKYPFQLAAPDKTLPRRIVNTAPLPGEPSEFVRDQAAVPGRADEMVALISMLPGVDPQQELLLINGIDAPATDMAAEFLTNPEALQDLATRLRALAPRKAHPHFQLVLRAEVREDVPTRATIVALRAF